MSQSPRKSMYNNLLTRTLSPVTSGTVQQTKYLALIHENGFLILALPLTSYQCFSALSDKGKPLTPARCSLQSSGK